MAAGQSSGSATAGQRERDGEQSSRRSLPRRRGSFQGTRRVSPAAKRPRAPGTQRRSNMLAPVEGRLCLVKVLPAGQADETGAQKNHGEPLERPAAITAIAAVAVAGGAALRPLAEDRHPKRLPEPTPVLMAFLREVAHVGPRFDVATRAARRARNDAGISRRRARTQAPGGEGERVGRWRGGRCRDAREQHPVWRGQPIVLLEPKSGGGRRCRGRCAAAPRPAAPVDASPF